MEQFARRLIKPRSSSAFDTITAQREDLFALVSAVQNRGEQLDQEPRRYLESLLLSFKRNGLSLTQDQRARLRGVISDLKKLEVEYLSTCDRSCDVWLTREELDGLESHLISNLETGPSVKEDKLRLELTTSRVHDVQTHAHSSNTRHKVYAVSSNACTANISRLQQTLALRAEKAQLLGHPSYACLRMAGQMHDSPEKMQDFLEGIIHQLSPIISEKVEKWRQMKRYDLRMRGEHDDGKFYPWDRYYYSEKLSARECGLENARNSEYFAGFALVPRMLGIFEKIMGIEFQELDKADQAAMSDGSNRGVFVWHEDVRLFAVWDDSNGDGRREEFCGYLYTDLHPREGKRGGFSDQPIRPAYTELDGSRRYTATAMLCDFPKPDQKKPGLLDHSAVVMLFHELGHAMHDLVSKTKYARFHGASCGDFNEAPSQMLEEWCWQPSTLRTLSQHYSKISPEHMKIWQDEVTAGRSTATSPEPDKLPEGLIEALTHSKRAKMIVRSLSIAQASLYELAINAPESKEAAEAIDTTLLWHTLACQTFRLDMPSELPPAQVRQPMVFTVDGLYVYLATLVYSYDMFATAFEQDPMSREAGLRYRRTVLEKGSSINEMEMLTDFLGRPPKADAFCKELGIKTLAHQA